MPEDDQDTPVIDREPGDTVPADAPIKKKLRVPERIGVSTPPEGQGKPLHTLHDLTQDTAKGSFAEETVRHVPKPGKRMINR